jgi:hypothetical protein
VFGSTPRMIGGPLIGLLVQNLAALPGYNRAGSTDNSVRVAVGPGGQAVVAAGGVKGGGRKTRGKGRK